MTRTRLPHILGGAAALGLGVYGIYDEYFVVIEFLQGFLQPLLALVGIVSMLAGILGSRTRPGHIVCGLLLLGVGLYGFFDEYYATLDFFKGAVPVALLLVCAFASSTTSFKWRAPTFLWVISEKVIQANGSQRVMPPLSTARTSPSKAPLPTPFISKTVP